jgi:hypothetical protein
MDEILAYVKEQGDRIYIQSPVGLYTPEPAEIESFAFAEDVKKLAPNPEILWMQGRYVEADKANSNGDEWAAGEIALKQLTPTLMPITVMHDLRSAVGTIASTDLRLPKDDASVPRARLETTLALWAHRFKDIAEEAKINAQQGTLMQSMECKSSSYECSVCGQLYQFMADRSDKERWCSHLKGEVDASGTKLQGARRLRSVVFTGTGLIFGTRGARGAYSEAHVDVEALAEFHAKARDGKRQSPRPRRKANVMEIEDKDYQALVAEKTSAESKVTELTAAAAEKDKALEKAEADKVKAEEEAKAEKERADKAEETARVATLRDERMEALGAGFTAKLAKLEATNKRVLAQAGTLSDEDWTARLEELEETLSVKRDAKAEEGGEPEDKDGDDADESTAGLMFDRKDAAGADLTASANGNGGGSATPSREARQSVVGGLIKPRKPATTGAAK